MLTQSNKVLQIDREIICKRKKENKKKKILERLKKGKERRVVREKEKGKK